MSLFNKKKTRSLRKKDTSGDENDNDNESDGPKLSLKDIAERKKKKGKEIGKGAVKLSFGEEEEEEVEEFKIKKTKESKRMVREMRDKKIGLVIPKREDETKLNKDRIGEYTSEKIEALKQSTLTVAGHSSSLGAITSNKNEPFKPQRNVTVIPDARLIHEARKKREYARNQGGTDDFISLSSTQGPEAGEGRDIEDDSGDDTFDDRGRVKFGDTRVIQRERREKEMRAAYENNKESHTDSDDDEINRWETEQIRKGGARSTDITLPHHNDIITSAQSQAYLSQHYMTPGQVKQPLLTLANQATPIRNIPIISPDAPSSVDDVMVKLQDTLTRLKTYHKETADNLHQLQDSLESTQGRVNQLETEYKIAGRTCKYFKDMHLYTSALIGCLDEKAPEIEKLETKMHQLLKERSAALDNNRIEVTEDYLEELEEMVPGSKFSRGRPNSGQAIDEFGRDRTVYLKNERKKRMTKRKFKTQLAGSHKKIEGLSSESEEEGIDSTNYNTELADLQQQCKDIFDDVSEQYTTVRSVRERLEGWKAAYPQAYKDAYVGLSVSRLMAPYVRLQMIGWEPMTGLGTDFEQQEWFTELLTYGQSTNTNNDSNEDPDDDDSNLVLDLMQRVLMPKLIGLARHCYNPMSYRHTRNLSNLLERLSDYPFMEVTNKQAQNLFSAIIDRLAQCLQENIVVPLIPKDKREDKKCSKIVQRQTWQAIKFTENACTLAPYLPLVRLQDIVIEGVINPLLLPVLAAGGHTLSTLGMVERIHKALPIGWLEDIPHMGQLSVLHRYRLGVIALCRGLSDTLSGSIPEERDALLRASTLLSAVYEEEKATALRDRHRLQTNV